MRCRGYKQRPKVTYRDGMYIGTRAVYGSGKCPACDRVIGITPKSQTIVLHKQEARR